MAGNRRAIPTGHPGPQGDPAKTNPVMFNQKGAEA
jgi:hypothetical protein